MNEIWKDVVNYEGLYQISNKGNVKRLYKNGSRIVKPSNRLYQDVDLSKNGVHKRQAIHRLVALHFIPNPNPNIKKEVNHIDGNKHNNCVENLEWVSQKENQEHAEKQLNKYAFGKPPKPVKKLDIETNEVVENYPSISMAAKSIGKACASVSIRNCCNGMQLSAYGYKWQYAE
ncbi:MAG: HNH endonuclease [Bacteroidales bacterium]|nr:HNH endonuclease [Candidatus Scybalousia scybalohippi]